MRGGHAGITSSGSKWVPVPGPPLLGGWRSSPFPARRLDGYRLMNYAACDAPAPSSVLTSVDLTGGPT